jgi:hypothetical protein
MSYSKRDDDVCTCGHYREDHFDGYGSCGCADGEPDGTLKECECEDFEDKPDSNDIPTTLYRIRVCGFHSNACQPGDIADVIREYTEPASEWSGKPEYKMVVAVNSKWSMPLHFRENQFERIDLASPTTIESGQPMLTRDEFMEAKKFIVDAYAQPEYPMPMDDATVVAVHAIRELVSLRAELEDSKKEIKKWQEYCGLGGLPLHVPPDFEPTICRCDPNDEHEIYGPGVRQPDGSIWCALHHNRTTINILQAQLEKAAAFEAIADTYKAAYDDALNQLKECREVLEKLCDACWANSGPLSSPEIHAPPDKVLTSAIDFLDESQPPSKSIAPDEKCDYCDIGAEGHQFDCPAAQD